MTVPLWRQTDATELIRCHAAVLGGGITGIAAGLALERRGVDALIIERAAIAAGASGRNAGYLMRGAADNYAAAARGWGRENARIVWRWTEENLAMLRAEGIESLPAVRRTPSCLLALSEEEQVELERSAELMRDDGFEVSLLTTGADAAWRSGRARLGLVNPNDGACNPADLLAFLAGKLRRQPLTHTEVTRIEAGSGRVRLRSAATTIEAEHCLICLNAYTPLLLPGLASLIEPKRGQILAFRTDGPAFELSYYANHGSEYFRQVTPNTAILGGWRKHFAEAEVGYEDRVTDDVQRGLEGFAASITGAPVEVVSRWSGTMGFTPDGLPLIGPVDEQGNPAAIDSPIWVCGGYTGHGMSMAFKAAHEAVDAMLGQRTPPFPVGRFAKNH